MSESLNILIELDALLDTRLTTLHGISESCIDNNFYKRYVDRPNDYFPCLKNKEEFFEKYKNRDKNVLKNSFRTQLHEYLRDIIHEASFNKNLGVMDQTVSITINTYPYDLSDQEKVFLAHVINRLIRHAGDVRFCTMTLEELTPSFLRENFNLIFYYDFLDWLDIHSSNGNLNKKACPNVVVHIPLLLRNDVTDQDIREYFQKENPFELLIKATELFIKLAFLPISMLSVDLKEVGKLMKAIES